MRLARAPLRMFEYLFPSSVLLSLQVRWADWVFLVDKCTREAPALEPLRHMATHIPLQGLLLLAAASLYSRFGHLCDSLCIFCSQIRRGILHGAGQHP